MRGGDGTVVQGLWGFMRPAGAGKTYVKLQSRVEGGVVSSLSNFGPAPFEGQGNHRAVKGRASDDEYTRAAANEVTVESTVTTHADFFSMRVGCTVKATDDEDDEEERERGGRDD